LAPQGGCVTMRLIFAILAVLAAAATPAAEDISACLFPTPGVKRAPQPDFTDALPIPDYLDTVVACNTGAVVGVPGAPPRPASAWLEAEQKMYADVLARSKADVLVVPFQIQGRGLDRVERTLMSADLAYAIGDAGALTVADPFLASLALGEGARRID